jgi:hypothetical protein
MNEPLGFLPEARRDGIIRKEVDGELLVYDLERNTAHCLNPTAAQVWKLSDGQTSISELALSLGKTLGTSLDESVVQLALKQLSADHLLVESYAVPPISAGLSRRALVRRLGLAAALLPLITTITAPIAAAAGSACTGTCVPGGVGNGGCALGCTCQATGPTTGICVNV